MGKGPRYILLVEDSPDDADLTMLALRQAKLANEVVLARDGAEAMDFLFAQGAYTGRDVLHTPAVVLLDLRLPKVNGLEVLERLRSDERTRLVPVVIMTASNEDEDMLRSYKSGANSFVRKPVAFDAFATAVSRVGLYWMLVNDAAA